MAKYFLVLITLFVGFNATSQTDEEIDIIAKDICETLKETKNIPDSLKLEIAIEKHLPPATSKFNLNSEERIDAFSQRLVYRLSKICPAFYTMIMKTAPQEELNMIKSSKPVTNISKKEAEEILKNKYYYIEDNSKVYVSIKDGVWIETFEDNTYSKLYFRWLNNYEFELEFIESNQEFRKYYSRKGEKYIYGIYGAENGVIKIWALNKPDNSYATFKLYPAKKV